MHPQAVVTYGLSEWERRKNANQAVLAKPRQSRPSSFLGGFHGAWPLRGAAWVWARCASSHPSFLSSPSANIGFPFSHSAQFSAFGGHMGTLFGTAPFQLCRLAHPGLRFPSSKTQGLWFR